MRRKTVESFSPGTYSTGLSGPLASARLLNLALARNFSNSGYLLLPVVPAAPPWAPELGKIDLVQLGNVGVLKYSLVGVTNQNEESVTIDSRAGHVRSQDCKWWLDSGTRVLLVLTH